ncbi:MAG: T9SS type A sorting domain-containing protein [Bacteroidota bacterium]
MKKKILLILSFTVVILVLAIDVNSTGAYSSSPPVSHAGAPLDNSAKTCATTGCHTGTALTATTGVISHNIPGSGFVGGTIYNFSVTMSGSSAYGFELTPQSPTSNAALGTWIAGVGTAVSTKYIRQSAKGTGAAKTWAFQWTAPTTATAVTFYGAFNYANNNGNSSGDIIKTCSLTVIANTTGLREDNSANITLSLFPNPTSETLRITSSAILEKGDVYTLDGKCVKTVSEQELLTKTISVSDLAEGLYFIRVFVEGNSKVMKFRKN